MRDTLFGNVQQEPWPFDRPSYLESTLTWRVNPSAKQLSRQRGTQARHPSRGSPARYSFRMTTQRKRPTPSGNQGPLPANTEAVRVDTRIREWPRRTNAIVFSERPSESLRRFRSRRSGQLSAGVWGSSGTLLGDEGSKSNRERSSASKGTRETQPSMAITRIGRRETVESSPMRRLGVGTSIVVGGRESRPHGEGKKEDSCWATKAFSNRKGFR
jgi:hypothetical protein